MLFVLEFISPIREDEEGRQHQLAYYGHINAESPEAAIANASTDYFTLFNEFPVKTTLIAVDGE